MSSLALLIRNSFVLLAGTVLSKGIVFASALILSRKLGVEGFGRFTALFVYVSFFSVLVDAGIESIVIREMGRKPEDSARRLGDAIVLRGILVALSIVGAVLLYPTVFEKMPPLGLLLLASASLILSNRGPSLRSLLEAPFRAALRMEIPSLLGVLTEGLFLALLLLTVDRWGLVAAVASQALAPLPFAWILAMIFLRKGAATVVPDPGRLARLLWSTLPLLGAMILSVLLARADVILLERMRGPEEVGLYAAPVRLVEAVALLPILLMTSVYPMLSASHPDDPRRVERLFRGSARFVAGLVVPVAVIQIAFSDAVVSAFFGSAYARSAAVLPVLAASQVLACADIVLTSRLFAAHLERKNLWMAIPTTATNIVANLVLIPQHGMVGAGIAVLLAYGVRLAMGFVWRDTREAVGGLLVSILPAIGAGAGAVALLLAHQSQSGVLAVPALLLYAALLVLFGGVSRREWDVIREIPRSLSRPPEPVPETEVPS